VAKFRIINDKTGEQENEGCTVRYAITEDFAPLSDENLKGYRPAKATVPYGDFGKFTTVPGLYEISMDASVDSQGKVSLKPSVFKFISGISVTKKALP
jgi:hypothetical protein